MTFMHLRSGNSGAAPDKPSRINLTPPPWLLGFIVLIALAVRLPFLGRPPLDYHPTRQYESALTARYFFYRHKDDLPTWKKDIAFLNRELVGRKELPIVQRLSAALFSFVGRENWYLPRLATILFWMLGGWFLYLAVSRMAGSISGLLSLTAHLCLPFGIHLSRSFMVESFMVMLLELALLALIHYDEKQSWKQAWFLGLIAGTAVAAKIVALFPFAAAFVLLSAKKQGFCGFLADARNRLILSLLAAVGLGRYFYLYFTEATLSHVADQVVSFRFLSSSYYFWGWKRILSYVAGSYLVFGALLGMLMPRPARFRLLVLGSFLGYLVYALIFSYTSATHDYYQATFFTAVTCGLGLLAPSAETASRSPLIRRLFWVLCLALALSMCRHQMLAWLPGASHKTPSIALGNKLWGRALMPLTLEETEAWVRRWEEIGRLVNHSSRTIILDRWYGLPLRYHGDISGTHWPTAFGLKMTGLSGARDLSVKERFQNYGRPADYFIADDIEELKRQPKLEEFLRATFPVMADTGGYVVFDLRPP